MYLYVPAEKSIDVDSKLAKGFFKDESLAVELGNIEAAYYNFKKAPLEPAVGDYK